MGEPGGVGGDADVAQTGEVEPARQRRAVDGGDRRDRKPHHRVVEAIARCPQRLLMGL